MDADDFTAASDEAIRREVNGDGGLGEIAAVSPFRHLADEFYRNNPGAKLRVGEKVRELREELGLTQVEVADKVRTTQPGVSRFEQQTDMHVSTLAKLANALGGRLRLFIDLPGGDQRELKVWPWNAGNHSTDRADDG